MKIALVGYGKMGHLLKNVAIEKGHTVAVTVDVVAPDADVKIPAGDGQALARAIKSAGVDGIIEFSHPSAVMTNIKALLPLGIPIVVGTTGWNDKVAEVEKLASDCGGTLLYSSNYSIGVNMFFKIVEEAVKVLQPFSEYDIAIHEMHHNQKADSPSGTALEIARRVLANTSAKTETVVDAFHTKPAPQQLHVSSTRIGSNPGEHTVYFDSPADTIELTHRARNREGFARGAVFSLEKLVAGVQNGSFKKGKIYTTDVIFS
ncbi:MAG: 4-hydroxy-tetrahydrodipicolinate reductase [Treponema sp.]|nr:4-hydroxy-tetrahydrodipicolinate reductase [Treponema sp.]